MTVVVAFLCTDGVVIAADSMLTPNVGNIPVGHHKGRKVHLLDGNQVLAFAGDAGLAARFRALAHANAGTAAAVPIALNYPLALTQALVTQFQQTGIWPQFELNAVLAFVNQGRSYCCIFMGKMQPWLMDNDHYYAALGSGKLSADPFLRFLVDIFCKNGPPTVREAVFLATWCVEHVIRTNPGGVAEPIKIAVLEQNEGGFGAREIPKAEIEEHRQAIESAESALCAWHNELQAGPAIEAPAPPEPPVDAG